MAKVFHPAVLTANDLVEGDAVWWTGLDWSRDVAEAAAAETPEAKTEFEALAADPALTSIVVGPYLVEIGEDRRPLLRRESIRADREPTFAYGAAAPLRDAA